MGDFDLLTSIVRKFDVGIIDGVERLVNDHFEPGLRVLTLADSAMDYSVSGAKLAAATIVALDAAKQSIIDGNVAFPPVPDGEVLPPLGHGVVGTIDVTIDQKGCHLDYVGPDLLARGAALRLNVVNMTTEPRGTNIASLRYRVSATVVEPLPGATASGFAVLEEDEYGVECGTDPEKAFRLATFVYLGEEGFRFQGGSVTGPDLPPPPSVTPFTGETIQGGGVLTIGATAYDLGPFYNNGQGFDADMTTAVAARIGLETDIGQTANGDGFEILAQAGFDFDLLVSLDISDAGA